MPSDFEGHHLVVDDRMLVEKFKTAAPNPNPYRLITLPYQHHEVAVTLQ